jgi:DNA polymerase III epsilon subunit-like protein
MQDRTYGESVNGFYRQTTMVHLNGNLLCSIDVKTTGLDSTEHEIYEIGILPVDSFLFRRKDRKPLDLLIRPNYPDKIDWNFLEKNNMKLQIAKALEEGHPQHVAMKLFYRWVEDLQLPQRKQIAPIGYNYSHESRFLRQWIGNLNYNVVFDDSNLRDVRVLARIINDFADIRGVIYPFRKVRLDYLAHTLNVYKDYGSIRSALHDAAIACDVYRQMLEMLRKEALI